MLERPDTSEAFNQLRMVKSTSLGNLIAFMEVFNLRFGAATTPAQRVHLPRTLPGARPSCADRVVKGASLDDTATVLANPGPVGDFFSKFDVDNPRRRPRSKRGSRLHRGTEIGGALRRCP